MYGLPCSPLYCLYYAIVTMALIVNECHFCLLFLVRISSCRHRRHLENYLAASEEMDVEENYLILKAKLAQATDPYAAKAWILTAKTLYANNFGVQVRLSTARVYNIVAIQSVYLFLVRSISD